MKKTKKDLLETLENEELYEIAVKSDDKEAREAALNIMTKRYIETDIYDPYGSEYKEQLYYLFANRINYLKSTGLLTTKEISEMHDLELEHLLEFGNDAEKELAIQELKKSGKYNAKIKTKVID